MISIAFHITYPLSTKTLVIVQWKLNGTGGYVFKFVAYVTE